MNYALQFDPYEVLGVSESSSLSEIRDAYRARSRKYHPDAGGDGWAFRVLTRSYEILSTARVMGRASEEISRGNAAPEPARRAPEPAPPTGEPRIRSGIRDTAVSPELRVDVEMLLLRFEIDNPMDLIASSPSDRNLSCNLNIAWPAADLEPPGPDRVAAVQRALDEAVRIATRSARPVSQQVRGETGRFVAWLSYASAVEAGEAFTAFHAALRERGLGVQQTIREVAIPRDWHR